MIIDDALRLASLELMSAQEIVEIASSAPGLCVSIYVPTFRKGQEVRQSAIHLTNLLTEVESQLADQGLRWNEIESVTSSARALIAQDEFWQHQGDGLVIFLSADSSKMYQLPLAVEPRQTVSQAFDITPLLPILSGDGRFYILALSANEVRLFDATRDSFTEVSIEGVPNGMAEALWADDHERQLQFHSGAGASPKGGGRSAMFFGTGDEGSMEQHKVDYKRYFDKVDAALAPTLKQHPAPIVLAGVGYLLPIYRKANTCAKLLDNEVHGNQDRTTAEEIHHASWEIAGPFFDESREASVARFHELWGSGLASTDQNEIFEAADAGRVQTLFVSTDIPSENGERINAAAVQALLKKGEIVSLAPNAMPAEQPMAATFRY